MVQTQRDNSFAVKYPLFTAVARGDSASVAELCRRPGLAAASVGPGGLTPLHICAVVDGAASVPPLVAAGVPVSGQLKLDPQSPQLAEFLDPLWREITPDQARFNLFTCAWATQL